MVGVVDEPLLGQAAVRDVGLRAGDAEGGAVLLALADPTAEHPAVAAVLVADAILHLEVLGHAAHVGLDGQLHTLGVLRVQALEPVAGFTLEVVLAQAQHLLPARAHVDLAVEQVPVPHAIVGAAHHELVARLGLPEAGLGALPGAHVKLVEAHEQRDGHRQEQGGCHHQEKALPHRGEAQGNLGQA